jgi:tRNA1(Val) A37 N6-methylase TrmN6
MAERIDGFLGGRLLLAQPARGHRAGADAALLASATPRDLGGLLLDIGAGVGAAGLSAALLAPACRVGLVEVDAKTAALARENIVRNGLEARAFVAETDALDAAGRRAAGLTPEAADVVLTNPPFHAAGRVRVSPDPAKALAHVAAVPFAAWARACLALLAPGGAFVAIHRADALGELLEALEGKLGDLALLPVAPRAGEAATRLLLRGVKGSRAPLRLLAPLVLHEADGAFTPRADAIFRGEGSSPL